MKNSNPIVQINGTISYYFYIELFVHTPKAWKWPKCTSWFLRFTTTWIHWVHWKAWVENKGDEALGYTVAVQLRAASWWKAISMSLFVQRSSLLLTLNLRISHAPLSKFAWRRTNLAQAEMFYRILFVYLFCFFLNLLRITPTRLRGNFCIKQFSGQPTFAGWEARNSMLEASAVAGTRRSQGICHQKKFCQMEQPEQRAGPWQWGINYSLERVEGNSVRSESEICEATVKWQKLPCPRPCHHHLLPHPCRGDTAGACAEMAPTPPGTEWEGAIPACPPRCHSQGTGVRTVASPLTPELREALHSQRSLCPAAASAETSAQHVYWDREPWFLY